MPRPFLVRVCVLLFLCSIFPFLLNCGNDGRCYYDTDCPQSQFCKDGACRNDLASEGCSSTKDCSKGSHCILKKCVLLPAGYKFPEPSPEPRGEPKTENKKEVVAELEPGSTDAGSLLLKLSRNSLKEWPSKDPNLVKKMSIALQ